MKTIEKDGKQYTIKHCVFCGKESAYELKKEDFVGFKCFSCGKFEIISEPKQIIDPLDPMNFFYTINNGEFFGLSTPQLAALIETMDKYRSAIIAFSLISNDLSKNELSSTDDALAF